MNAKKLISPPFDRAYIVKPGWLVAGIYPGDKLAEQAREKILALMNAGITCFLDLTEPNELLPYSPSLAAISPIKIQHLRFPIRDLSVPTHETMVAILDQLDTLKDAGQTVYLHCWGGVGRTGTVVGCYLVRHGLSGSAALTEIKRLRASLPEPDRSRPSPETSEQRRMVSNWQVSW